MENTSESKFVKQKVVEEVKPFVAIFMWTAYGMIFGDLLNDGGHVTPLVIIAMGLSLSNHILGWMLNKAKTRENPI